MVRLDEIYLKNLCSGYNLKIKVFQKSIYIVSKIDEWFLEIKGGGYSYLYHKNKRCNMNNYHKQKTKRFANNKDNLPDFKMVFKYVYEHDEYVMSRKGKNFKVLSLLNTIKKTAPVV